MLGIFAIIMLGQTKLFHILIQFNDGASSALVNNESFKLKHLTIIILIQTVQNVHKILCTLYNDY